MKKLFTLLVLTLLLNSVNAQIIISEVYGGSTTTTTNACDFVVIKNSGTTSVVIDGYKLYYGSGANSNAPALSATIPASTTLAAGAMYVIRLGCTSGNTNQSTPYGPGDLLASTAMGATAGRVYLTTGAAPSPVCAPTNALGAVFYGTQGTCTSNAPAPSNTNSIISINGSTFTTNALPVVLVSFTVSKSNLTFSTASESNNSHFVIERSANGKDFVNIGRVAGAGFSNEVRNYGFTDATPLKGFNYYRLKQVDFDGRFEYSKVVSSYVGNKVFEATVVSAQSDLLRLNVFSQISDEASISVYDMNGRMISTQNVTLVENDNEISLSSNLQSGVYVIKIATSNGEQISKMLNIR